MLTHLHIENFAIIEDTDAYFYNGMNVILGETGAGKSILMDALSLLSGSRSDFEKIRNGKDKAFIEGVFKIENKEQLEYLKDLYSDYLEDDTFIFSRSLDLKGKSIQRLNGRLVSLSLMKEIMSNMLDIHSSSKDLVFFDEKRQLSILDKFIKGNSSFNDNENEIYNEYNFVYKEYVELLNKKEKLEALINDDLDIDYINYQINELKNADLKENEIEDLEQELLTLNNIVSLSEKMERFISFHDKASSYLCDGKRMLENVRNDSFAPLIEKYLDAYYSLDEAFSSLTSEFEEVLNKGAQIENMRKRLYFLRGLQRKYGGSTSDMIDKLLELEATIEEKENAEYELRKLNIQINELYNILLNKDNKLKNLREKYALKLEKAIDKELDELLFNTASFKVEFVNSQISKNGVHDVVFKLRANEGMEYLSLKDTASLGESSRLSLALKKVFFDFSFKETLIFDEIDIGISGKAALRVGEKIYDLSKKTQVICISHLGQVSIKGDHHFLVKKEVVDHSTVSTIIELDEKQAINEIASMVSGGIVDESSINLVKSWK